MLNNRLDRKWNYLWSTALVLYVLFIYFNSLMPAGVSSQQSGFVLQMVQRMLQLVGANQIGVTEHFIRKMAHFSEYMVLGILLYQCMQSYGLSVRERLLVTAFVGLIVPFFDETIQLFVVGRSGQISDVWIDYAGVLFGNLIMYGCSIFRFRGGNKH